MNIVLFYIENLFSFKYALKCSPIAQIGLNSALGYTSYTKVSLGIRLVLCRWCFHFFWLSSLHILWEVGVTFDLPKLMLMYRDKKSNKTGSISALHFRLQFNASNRNKSSHIDVHPRVTVSSGKYFFTLAIPGNFFYFRLYDTVDSI